jgi:hypothetical protein
MIRIIIILIIQAIPFLPLFSQSWKCGDLIASYQKVPFDKSGIKTLKDYIKIYFPNERRHVGNIDSLAKVNLICNLGDVMIFQEQSTKVEMSFVSDTINTTLCFYPKIQGENYSRILQERDNCPYGITSEDSLVSKFSSMSVNGIKTPEYAYSDLINPTRSQLFMGVKPIEVYKSSCEEYLYIYLTGELNLDIMIPAEAINYSYIAKLIFTNKGYYVGRIVERGDRLKYFGFGECYSFGDF